MYGLFAALTDGVGKAWVSLHAASVPAGRGAGVRAGATGFAVLVAGVWAGLAWGEDGTVPLVIAGTVAGVLAVALLVAPRRR